MATEALTSQMRSTRPSPAVLEAALQGAREHVRGAAWGRGWAIGARIERPTSTVFPLQLIGASGASVTAFYKTYATPRHREEGVRDELRHSLETRLGRMARMDARLAALTQGRPIRLGRVLAVDPSALTVVTLGVHGRPLGAAWRSVVGLRRGRTALWQYRVLGEALKLIDRCGAGEATLPLATSRAKMQRMLTRRRELFSTRDYGALEELLQALQSQCYLSPRNVTYAHGDVSDTNVLRCDHAIGLIDFSWSPEFRGYDLSNFVVRLEYHRPFGSGWAGKLMSALMEGYGDPKITAQPAWTLHRLRRLLSIAGRRHRLSPLQLKSRNRALAEILAILREAEVV